MSAEQGPGTPEQQAKLAAARAALAAATGGPAESTDQAAPPPPPDPQEGVREADPYAVARRIVLRQLTMAPRSRHELAQKLRQCNCPDDVAEAVLDRFESVGLINDELYAETLARSKQEHKGLGRRGVAQELAKKGIDPELRKAVLDDIDEADERERARVLVEQRVKRMTGLERVVQTRRLAGLLARKGYSSGVAMSVIREVLDELPEHQRD